jgi:hypothetical protein
MASGQDVCEYIHTFGLVKSHFFKFFEKMQLKKFQFKSVSLHILPSFSFLSQFLYTFCSQSLLMTTKNS